jgi:hypothetical protein
MPHFQEARTNKSGRTHKEFAAILSEAIEFPGITRYIVVVARDTVVPCTCGDEFGDPCPKEAIRRELRTGHNFTDFMALADLAQNGLALVAHQWDAAARIEDEQRQSHEQAGIMIGSMERAEGNIEDTE